MRNYSLPVVIEKDAEGYYAECPSLQGCYSQGATYEEALDNIRDAMVLHIQDRVENGEAIPLVEMISLVTLDVVA